MDVHPTKNGIFIGIDPYFQQLPTDRTSSTSCIRAKRVMQIASSHAIRISESSSNYIEAVTRKL